MIRLLVHLLALFLVLRHECSAVSVFADIESTSLSLTCKNYGNPTPMLRLKRHLFCEYDHTVRPTLSHQILINVTMKLLPKILEFDEWNGRMTLHSWMPITWIDSHLSWMAADFDDINYIHVKSDEIWVPDLSVYNSGDMSFDQTGIPLTTCLIFASGVISCVPSVKHVAKCSTDFASWPYDTHQCRVNFGSWSHSGEEIDFHLDKQGFQAEEFTNNTEWDFKVTNAYKVLRKYKCCPNDTYPMIVYKFSITRHHGMMHSTYVTPAMAVMLLTLTVLWLDSRSTERMIVACVNLICHMLCIFDLHWQLPHNGSNPPNILLYYRDSLAMAVFAIIWTVILRRVHESNVSVPDWISRTTSFVLRNRAGRFLLLADLHSKSSTDGILRGETEETSDLSPNEAAETSSGTSVAWRQFAVIVEWVSLFVVMLTYIILLATLLPPA